MDWERPKGGGLGFSWCTVMYVRSHVTALHYLGMYLASAFCYSVATRNLLVLFACLFVAGALLATARPHMPTCFPPPAHPGNTSGLWGCAVLTACTSLRPREEQQQRKERDAALGGWVGIGTEGCL